MTSSGSTASSISAPDAVILLKARSEDGDDEYGPILSSFASSAGIAKSSSRSQTIVHYIQVLDYALDAAAQSTLVKLFSLPPSSSAAQSAISPSLYDPVPPSAVRWLSKFPYSGLIVTSARGVEALQTALQTVIEQSKKHDDNPPQDMTQGETNLSSFTLPIFVVGPATARAAHELKKNYLKRCTVLGEEAGNAQVLAELILRTWKASIRQEQGGEKGMLWLAGEKRKDTLKKVLMADSLSPEDRVPLEELVVYRTTEREFTKDLAKVLDEVAREGDDRIITDGMAQNGKNVFIILFSPTGSAQVLRHLNWLDPTTNLYDPNRRLSPNHRLRNIFLASIGPTTARYVRDTFGLEVDVCAVAPNPQSLKRGIEEFLLARSNTKESERY